MSKWGWLVVILLVGGLLYNSHLESKKHVIVKGIEINSGRIVEADWKELKQALKTCDDVMIDISCNDNWKEVVVLEAYKGNRGEIIIRSNYPIKQAFYKFNSKDVSYVYRTK